MWCLNGMMWSLYDVEDALFINSTNIYGVSILSQVQDDLRG